MYKYLLLLLISTATLSQTVVLNEIMSNNTATIADDFDDYSDWIEIYNPQSADVCLKGLFLSDTDTNPAKWPLPDVILGPGQYLLIFASDRNRSQRILWDTVIDHGDTFRYFPVNTKPPQNWRLTGFDDSNWNTGPSGFGYSDGDDATVIPQTLAIFIRKSFLLERPDHVDTALFHMDYDDAFVAWLNGIEIARANIGETGDFPNYDQPADISHEALLYQGNPPDLFPIKNIKSILREGENVLAVQDHNIDLGSSDLTCLPFLTFGFDGKTAVTDRHVSEYLSIANTYFHTNFKIKSAGEPLYLFDSGGGIIDSAAAVFLPQDISYSRFPDGADNWIVTAVPTPESPNSNSPVEGFSDPPVFSHHPGYYDSQISLEMSSNSKIYYTTDGSEPTQDSKQYSGPITVNKTSVIRARTIDADYLPSEVVTATFILNDPSTLPVICLTTDPDNLWDNETGIFARGDFAESSYPYFGANFWQDWERPVHVEFREPDGTPGFFMNAGIKVFGGWSRGRDQKSVSIFARAKYGTGKIDYRLFPNLNLNSFEAFILRNSGNDWSDTMFRDAFMQELTRKKMDIDIMAYRPARIYLNGEYWGILNIREKINEHFIASHHPFQAEQIEITEQQGYSSTAFREFFDYIETHDLRNRDNYQHVCRMMDMENFLHYQIAQIYYSNTDWPGNNIKFWRPDVPYGRWRWIMFDTDFGFAHVNTYSHNTLSFATETNGPDWPNPPWSTLILRKLLQNETFRRLFINTFADHINTTFQPEHLKELIDVFKSGIEDEIYRHRDRWPGSAGNWNSEIANMKTYAEHRPDLMWNHLRAYFHLAERVNVTLSAVHGTIRINTILPPNLPWTGEYFKDIPVTLQAIPDPGYEFTGWSEPDFPDTTNINIFLYNDRKITAFFKSSDNSPFIVINEINYNANFYYESVDWVEFFNNSTSSIDLSGWTFRDQSDSNSYSFPANSIITPFDFYIVCRDTSIFSRLYPDVQNVKGNFSFGLSSNGDAIRLFNNTGLLVDSVFYQSYEPWPTAANGAGYSLELMHPASDNTQPGNWQASTIPGGSPGVSNTTRTDVQDSYDRTVDGFSLYPVFPNPFNDQTNIRIDVPKQGHVRMEIFNTTGQSVQVLQDGILNSGTFSIKWQATLPSGLYFCVINYENKTKRQTLTRKMILLR
ncbi:CotH kinase family protein [candidate division KSB1 bacterium]|nr:CotH kinase family protein [candidate division KSB1 bacterium]